MLNLHEVRQSLIKLKVSYLNTSHVKSSQDGADGKNGKDGHLNTSHVKSSLEAGFLPASIGEIFKYISC